MPEPDRDPRTFTGEDVHRLLFVAHMHGWREGAKQIPRDMTWTPEKAIAEYEATYPPPDPLALSVTPDAPGAEQVDPDLIARNRESPPEEAPCD